MDEFLDPPDVVDLGLTAVFVGLPGMDSLKDL